MDRGKLLRILLRQPCMYQDAVVLCKLLCCSKALGSSAVEAFSGRVLLHVRVFTDSKAMQLQHWLSRHSGCLQELHVQHDPELDLNAAKPFVHQDFVQAQHVEMRVWDAEIEASLQQAAVTAPRGLQLRCLRFVDHGLCHGTVLPHLSASLLTQLELHLDDREDFPNQAYARVFPNLARLTNLHHLVLTDSWAPCGAAEHLEMECTVGAAVSCLQHLTYLQLRARLTVADAAVLPVSLVELHLRYSPERDQECWSYLQLGHLTALTHLRMGLQGTGAIEAGDVLPPNARKIWTQDEVRGSKPFHHLGHLEQLSIQDCNMPAQDLEQLTALTALTALGINYVEKVETDAAGSWVQQADAAAHIWKQLPLVELGLQVDSVAWPTVEVVRDLTQLTHLYIGWCEFGAMPHVLARQIKQWTNLRQLWMDDWTVAYDVVQQNGQVGGPTAGHDNDSEASHDLLAEHEGDMPTAAAAVGLEDPEERVSVVAAIVELPDLRDLSLFGWHWSAALPGLVTATRLTKLTLDACNIDDGTVIALASSLTDLRDLSLPEQAADSRRASYTCACLPALARLQHLTALSLNKSMLDAKRLDQYPRLAMLLAHAHVIWPFVP